MNKISKFVSQNIRYIDLFFLLAVFITLLFAFNLLIGGEEHFAYLARAFFHFKPYYLEPPDGTWLDTVSYNGLHFWHQGPMPAVILMPFTAAFNLGGILFKQGYLQPFLVLGVFYLSFKIARLKKISKYDSLVLAFAFCFASTFFGSAVWSWSWFFGQVVATFFWFLVIYEYSSVRRYWLIGLILGCIFLTRQAASVGIIFFVLMILSKSKQKGTDMLKLLAPFGLAILISFWYNFIRFENIFQTGYNLNEIPDIWVRSREKYGIFNLFYVPTNLYYMLLAPPQILAVFPFLKTNFWGLSVLINSPYLVILWFLKKYFDIEAKLLILTVILVCLPSLLFYSTGWRQFGYRYALDFLPLLQLLIIKTLGERKLALPKWFFPLVVISAVFNLYLFGTIFL